MIVQELQNFVAHLDRRIMQDKNWVEMFTKLSKELEPVSGLVSKSVCLRMLLKRYFASLKLSVVKVNLREENLTDIRIHFESQALRTCNVRKRNEPMSRSEQSGDERLAKMWNVIGDLKTGTTSYSAVQISKKVWGKSVQKSSAIFLTWPTNLIQNLLKYLFCNV